MSGQGVKESIADTLRSQRKCRERCTSNPHVRCEVRKKKIVWNQSTFIYDRTDLDSRFVQLLFHYSCQMPAQKTSKAANATRPNPSRKMCGRVNLHNVT